MNKKYKVRRWVRVVLTILVIHISFFIWKQTGTLGELAQKDRVYLALCIAGWVYLIIGQVMIYGAIWEK